RGRMKYHQLLLSRELGGAAGVALDLAKVLSTNDRHGPVWIPGPGPAWSRGKELGLNVVGYDSCAVFSNSRIQSTGLNWNVWRRLRVSGGGLVHVPSPLLYGALRRALVWSGLKQIVHIQIDEDEQGLRWALRRPPDLIVTCAQFLA